MAENKLWYANSFVREKSPDRLLLDDFLQTTKQEIETYMFNHHRSCLVVGISGDLDSAVAAVALSKMGLPIIGCHVVINDENGEASTRIRLLERVLPDMQLLNIDARDGLRLICDQNSSVFGSDTVRHLTSFRHQMVLGMLNAAARRISGSARIATLNRTELYCGSYLKEDLRHGDCFPFIRLFKTQVRQFGAVFGLDRFLLGRAPSRQVIPWSLIQPILTGEGNDGNGNDSEIWNQLIIKEDSNLALLPPMIFQLLDPVYELFESGLKRDEIIQRGIAPRNVDLALALRLHFDYKISPLVYLLGRNEKTFSTD